MTFLHLSAPPHHLMSKGPHNDHGHLAWSWALEVTFLHQCPMPHTPTSYPTWYLKVIDYVRILHMLILRTCTRHAQSTSRLALNCKLEVFTSWTICIQKVDTHTRTHTHTHIHKHTQLHTHANTYTNIHNYTHTYTWSTHTHTTYIHIQTPTHTHTHTHIPTHTCTPHTHTGTHTHPKHTHPHTHPHTNAGTTKTLGDSTDELQWSVWLIALLYLLALLFDYTVRSGKVMFSVVSVYLKGWGPQLIYEMLVILPVRLYHGTPHENPRTATAIPGSLVCGGHPQHPEEISSESDICESIKKIWFGIYNGGLWEISFVGTFRRIRDIWQ